MARPTIHDRPMTAAERKARSRTMQLGTVVGYLEQAEQLATTWARDRRHADTQTPPCGALCSLARQGHVDGEIADAFAELRILIQNAINSLPRS